MKKVSTVLALVLLACILTGCLFESIKMITYQHSPDENYTVYLYQVGSPQWSFGGVTAKLVLKNANGKKLDEKTFELANDGGGVTKGNILEVVWSENSVEVQMREFDTTRQFSYTLNYK